MNTLTPRRIIPFSPPDISELEINEIAEELRSGWITTGPRTKLLERRLAAYIETGRTDVDTENNADYWSNRVVWTRKKSRSRSRHHSMTETKNGFKSI